MEKRLGVQHTGKHLFNGIANTTAIRCGIQQCFDAGKGSGDLAEILPAELLFRQIKQGPGAPLGLIGGNTELTR